MTNQAEPTEIRHELNGGRTRFILGADSARHGLVSMQTADSTFNFVREPYFALNLYRLMSGGRLKAIARQEPFRIAASTAERLTLEWNETEQHPVRTTASWSLADPDTIDLDLSIEALQSLPDYEISISSYFDFALEPYTVISRWPGKTEANDLRLLKVEDHPYIKGYYVCFPRESRSAHLRTDGRWRDEKTGSMIAHHVFGPYFGRAIAIMAQPGQYIVQMTDPRHCNAIDTTYSSPDKEDSIMRHNALYFNLFGEDLQPGDRRTTRIRQVLCQGEVNLESVLALYDSFIASI